MRKRTALGLFAGLVALVVTPAAATASTTNYQIAFARQIPTGGANVFIANPDGSSAHQVPLAHRRKTSASRSGPRTAASY